MTEKTNDETIPFQYPIRIDRQGRWFHEEVEIQRLKMIKLFATVLNIDDKGRYWLKTPAEQGIIDVKDVPFIVVGLDISQDKNGQRLVELRTNLGDLVALDASRTIEMKGNIPYVDIRNGLKARLRREILFDLADLAEKDSKSKAKYGFYSGGMYHELES